MIWTFLLGIIAGWCAPGAEARLKPYVDEHVPGGPISPSDMRAISLAVCLVLAAVVAALTGSSKALPLTLGAIIGVLGPRLWDTLREMRAPDYDS